MLFNKKSDIKFIILFVLFLTLFTGSQSARVLANDQVSTSKRSIREGSSSYSINLGNRIFRFNKDAIEGDVSNLKNNEHSLVILEYSIPDFQPARKRKIPQNQILKILVSPNSEAGNLYLSSNMNSQFKAILEKNNLNAHKSEIQGQFMKFMDDQKYLLVNKGPNKDVIIECELSLEASICTQYLGIHGVYAIAMYDEKNTELAQEIRNFVFNLLK